LTVLGTGPGPVPVRPGTTIPKLMILLVVLLFGGSIPLAWVPSSPGPGTTSDPRAGWKVDPWASGALASAARPPLVRVVVLGRSSSLECAFHRSGSPARRPRCCSPRVWFAGRGTEKPETGVWLLAMLPRWSRRLGGNRSGFVQSAGKTGCTSWPAKKRAGCSTGENLAPAPGTSSAETAGGFLGRCLVARCCRGSSTLLRMIAGGGPD